MISMQLSSQLCINMLFVRLEAILYGDTEESINGWQLAKMKKSIPDMSLP